MPCPKFVEKAKIKNFAGFLPQDSLQLYHNGPCMCPEIPMVVMATLLAFPVKCRVHKQWLLVWAHSVCVCVCVWCVCVRAGLHLGILARGAYCEIYNLRETSSVRKHTAM